MNRIHLYRLKSRSIVIIDKRGTEKEFRQMYTRTLRLYKGISNTLEFEVRNSDHRKENITGLIPIVTIFDSKQQKLLPDKEGTIVTGVPNAFSVEYTENDLVLLEQQTAHIVIKLVDRTSDKSPIILYGDVGYGIKIFVDILDGFNDRSNEAFVISTFNYNYNFITMIGTFTSEIAPLPTAEDNISDTSDTKNVIIYPGAYKGTIKIEVTKDMSTSNANKWEQILDTIPITSNEIYQCYVPNNDKYTYIRFVCDAGNGLGATFDIRKNVDSYEVSLVQRGIGYNVGDVLVVKGSYLGGDDGINDLTINITGVNSYPQGALHKTGFTVRGIPSTPIPSETTLFRNVAVAPIPKRISPEKIEVLQ